MGKIPKPKRKIKASLSENRELCKKVTETKEKHKQMAEKQA